VLYGRLNVGLRAFLKAGKEAEGRPLILILMII
jgi:hypothetical protein